VRRRIRGRWTSGFARWVGSYGVTRLTGDLGRLGQPVTTHAVYDWVSGRRVPEPARALALCKLSRGMLSLEQIYAQRKG